MEHKFLIGRLSKLKVGVLVSLLFLIPVTFIFITASKPARLSIGIAGLFHLDYEARAELSLKEKAP